MNRKLPFGTLSAAVLTALLLLGGAGCATSPKHVFPGANWEHNQAGLSPEVIREVDAFVRTLDTTSLMVVKDGKVVYEYGNVAEPTYLASARKSVLSMLYGPYVANGTIRLDATLKDLDMSDVGGLLPIEERATVLDLITARSGVYHPASNDGDLLEFAPQRGSQEPGSYWISTANDRRRMKSPSARNTPPIPCGFRPATWPGSVT
jgi:CubicO group peptidase (beta-lactamase class C family)